jgi:hypothetical protein
MAAEDLLEQAAQLLEQLTDVPEVGAMACDGPDATLCTVHGDDYRGGQLRDSSGWCPHRRAHELLEELGVR